MPRFLTLRLFETTMNKSRHMHLTTSLLGNTDGDQVHEVSPESSSMVQYMVQTATAVSS